MKLNLSVKVDENEVLKRISTIENLCSQISHEGYELRKVLGDSDVEKKEHTAKE